MTNHNHAEETAIILETLANQHVQADYGSGIGGRAEMSRLEERAIETIRNAGFEPPAFIGASTMREWAAKIRALAQPNEGTISE